MHRVLGAVLAAALAACQQAPAGRLVDLAALQRDVAALGTRVTLVNFWATWCAPCVAELPDLVAEASDHPGVGLVLVSQDLITPGTDLTVATAAARVQGFLEQRGIDHPTLVYSGRTADLLQLWDLPGPLPTTIVLDSQGRVLERHEGQASRAEFRALIERSLGAP